MYRLVIFFALFNLVYGQSAQLMNLTITCEESGLNVTALFDSPFNGIIYSKNFYKDENCRFIKPNANSNLVQFQVKRDSCGLIENLLEPLNEGKHEYRSTIIIQKHPDYQNRFDTAKSIICTWFNLYRTSITQKPIIVGSLNEEEFITSDNSVEVFIDVRKAENANPFKKNINGIMQIGQLLTVSVFLIDKKQLFDVKATNCHLYDRHDFIDSRKINLTNEEGCSTDALLFDGFKKIDNVQKDDDVMNMLRLSEDNQKILNSNIILTGNLNVIKFPEVTDIFVSCNIEICKGNCNSKCHPPFKIEATTPTSSDQPSSSDLKVSTTSATSAITTTSSTSASTAVEVDPETATTSATSAGSLETEDTIDTSTTSPTSSEITTTSDSIETTTGSSDIITTDNPSISKETTQNYENRFEKRRLLLKTKSIGKKLNYNHNGLIMNGVDNSTIVLLAKIQAREQKRSLTSSVASPISSKFKLKPTRSLIDNFLKNHIMNRAIRERRNNFRNSIVIDQPNTSLARITINENRIKENGRHARLLLTDQDTVILDHLVLTKSFVLI